MYTLIQYMKRWHFKSVGKGLFFNKQHRKNSLAIWKKKDFFILFKEIISDGLKI